MNDAITIYTGEKIPKGYRGSQIELNGTLIDDAILDLEQGWGFLYSASVPFEVGDSFSHNGNGYEILSSTECSAEICKVTF